MFVVEIYAAVRRFVFVEGKSRREAARVFGLSRETIAKMCRFSVPPGYVRSEAGGQAQAGGADPGDRGDPGGGPDGAAEAAAYGQADLRAAARRARLCRRLHGGEGSCAAARARGRETFVPLAHPPGHAQVDFGEAVGGDRRGSPEGPFLLHGPAAVGRLLREGLPRETTEAFLDGHVSAFAFFGGVPLSILYDNTQAGGGAGSAATASASGPGRSPAWSAITCSRIGSAVPARGTTRARSRGW